MQQKMRIAINGFGRIGRQAARIAINRPDIDLVAINDPSPTELSAHLLEFDSNYGRFEHPVSVINDGKGLKVGDEEFLKYTSRNIEDLPWGDLNIDVVLECTGVFRTKETAGKHLAQGAKKVLLSAPAKSEGFKTIVIGVNEDELTGEDAMVSCASCTTNCLAPLTKVLDDAFGIENALMTTIHSYTNDQRILDVGHKDFRRARAAGLSMIPTTTGAAKAVGVVIPSLKGKLNGLAVRVPTPTGSLTDTVYTFKKEVTADEVKTLLKAKAAASPVVFGYEEKPLVSKDYIGDPRSCIVDADTVLSMGKSVKVMAWYDNEWGYANRLVDLAKLMG